MVSGTDYIAQPAGRWSGFSVSERRLGLTLLAVGLIAGAAWRLWFASVDNSIYWPDEVFQTLEPAHGLAYGYGFRPWEFIEGARNWFFPGVLAVMLRGLDAVGLDAPAQYLAAFAFLFSVLGVLTAWGCFALARSLGASIAASAAGAAIFALAAPLIYLSPRALGETVSAAPIVFAFALALREGAGRRALFWAASLLGVAVLLRLQNGVFCLGLLGILAGRRQWANARYVFLVLTLWAGFLGVLDWVTWGRPFHSALVYLKFNLIDGKASIYGTAPWTYYLTTLWSSAPAMSAIGGALFLAGYRRAPGLSWTALIAFVSLWLIPHKELRFVVPALPLFCAIAAAGLDRVGAAFGRWGGTPALAAGVVAAGLISAPEVGRLSFGDLGQVTFHRTAETPALDHDGAAIRLLMAAHDQPELCGLFVDRELVWTGGYVHLHRDVPVSSPRQPGGRANYAIAAVDPRARSPGLEGRVVVADGDRALIRLARPRCGSAASTGGERWTRPSSGD